MNKNTDERTIVISREMFNRIVPELESSDPAFAESLVRHASRFNTPYRKELEKKQRAKEKQIRDVAKQVAEFVEAHRGKKVWIRDCALPRVVIDYDTALKLIQDPEVAKAVVDRCQQPIAIEGKVITKSPGGLGVVVEFPRVAKDYHPVRVNLYLEFLSLEQPEGEDRATPDEVVRLDQLYRSLDILTPQARARVMREGLEDHLKAPLDTVEYTSQVRIVQN